MIGVRKVTPPDEELKIIVFIPFVLHYIINEVLRLLTSWGLEGVVTCACCNRFPTCGVLTHTFSTRGFRVITDRFATRIIRCEVPVCLLHPLPYSQVHVYPLVCTSFSKKKIQEKQKVVKFSWRDTPWQGGNRNTYSPGKVACLCECEDRGASLILTTFVNFQILSTIMASTYSPLSTVGW
jgi:hypothetical protein